MTDVKIAAILRSPVFSPNHIANDAAILNAVAANLRRRGRRVNVYTERELREGMVKEPVVVSMSRERASLALLREMEDAGRMVINSAYGIENCRREFLGRRLEAAGISFPKSICGPTDRKLISSLESAGIGPCWVKRADSHSQHKEDVTFAFTPREAQELVQEYYMRGISSASIDQHLEGVLVKFYGVVGTDFFHCYHRSHDVTYDSSRLRDLSTRAASALGLEIYGGDAIYNPVTDLLSIINVNDWPSFAPCLPEATRAIAGLISQRIKHRK